MPSPLTFNTFKPTPMVADNTRVVIQPKPEKAKKAIPKPQQHYLSQAPEMTPQRRREIHAAENRRKAQENLNAMANLDPTAAQINGQWKAPDGNWHKVGPTPLEAGAAIAFGQTLPGQIVTGGLTAKSVVKTVKDPSVENIVGTTIKVGLYATAMRAEMVHAASAPQLGMAEGTYTAYSVGVPKAKAQHK